MKSKYPWELTRQQKKFFERICVNRDNGVPVGVANALIAKGLIIRHEERHPLCVIYRYEVSTPIHMEWCEWCAKNFDDDGNEITG